jgi:hypothetical protein
MTATAPHDHQLSPAFRLDPTEPERSALWAMNRAQRIAAMWAGQLSHGQLLAWTRSRPNEIPLLAGEFAWLVMLTPEWAESRDSNRDNVIHLPQRSHNRAAA